ncbi:hypothetical protein J4408_02370 [Candidatus Pacearchaeota archaeon]|nr:hypothetical protein [Candidatus Pacearchaeota archaeon]
MSQDQYTLEQQKSLKSVRDITGKLIEIEDLQRRAYQPIYDMNCAMNQAVADLSLDNLQPYHVLEERLRKAVAEARSLGLGNDPLIEKVGALAFS